MEGLPAKLNDLPDEILFLIFKKLDNIEVLYLFIGVNKRFNKLVHDSIFTNHLTMTRCSSNGSFDRLDNQILDRFCSQILPSIHHKIKWLDIESSFMEDVLLCTSYPNLCALGLHNIEKDIALRIFTDETPLTHIFQDKISSFVIDVVQDKNISATDNSKANIFACILTLFSKLKYFHYRPTFWYQPLFQIPSTISSSTLLELHVKLKNFTDCLYLLDGRFDSLQKLSVDIYEILSPQIIIDNKKQLFNLKLFSLYSERDTDKYNELIVPLLHRMINLEELDLHLVVYCEKRFIDGYDLKYNIINNLLRLNIFIFNIRSRLPINDQVYLSSNEDCQLSFNGFKNKIISCVDYFPTRKEDKYNELIVPLLHRMINLEELDLHLVVYCEKRFIDGYDLKYNIINNLLRLNIFIFNIRSRLSINDQVYLSSNEDCQLSFNGFKNKIISCVDYFPNREEGQCHIYSYPYQAKYYEYITNNFPDGLFKYVREVSLYDERPFEHEFFVKIAKSFPFMEQLTVYNDKPQKNKFDEQSKDDNRHLSVIQYPYLSVVDLFHAHDDYVEQFLLAIKTCLTTKLNLQIYFSTLDRVTNNFTRDATRTNCAKLLRIHVPHYDDDNDVQLGNNTFYKHNVKNDEPQEQEQETLKAENTQKTARQTMIERKLHEADARAQTFTQAIRSQTLEAAQSRQMMRESTIFGSMKQPWPSSTITDIKEQSRTKLSQTYNCRTHNPNQYSNEETCTVRTHTERPNDFNKSIRNKNNDDRPITPMRATYRQIADKFGDEDGLPIDPTLTNQYYEAYDDFEKEDDYSPTREHDEKEFYDQVCRSVNGQEIIPERQRIMSASRNSTINSMSRTIDPRNVSNQNRPSKYITSSRTIASTTKQKPLTNRTIDENNLTLKDNPICDAYGPLAKNRKITSLRTKAIQTLGEETFDKVHNYLVKQRSAQRTNPTLDETQITQGLTAFVKKTSDCFLVDQLVFLELV
ncbi:unnamed protein product [Rotaria sp. Silwood2]|nr:unnamed protein product [Rotaria sp. Silwood2]